MNGLAVLHLDADLIVVNKPAGLLSVPGRGADKQDCVVHRLQAEGHPEALIVHRLDMATSGLLLLARGAAAQRALSTLYGPQPPMHDRLHLHACHLSLPARGLTLDCPPDF